VRRQNCAGQLPLSIARNGSFASDVAAGAGAGFGIVLLKTASANLCVVVQDKNEAHRQLILLSMEKLTFDMRAAPNLTTKSADDAFVATRKMQCGAVYASAPDLKAISEGLNRDKIPFINRLHPRGKSPAEPLIVRYNA
jgi:hypothetical protein